MLKKLFKFALGLTGLIIAIPYLFYIWVLIRVELSEELISSQHIPEYGDIRVTKEIDPGMNGPGYGYTVDYKPLGKSKFSYVTSWSRPPGKEKIEVYRYRDDLILLTPHRSWLSILDRKGRRKAYDLESMFRDGKLSHQELDTKLNHSPSAKIIEFDDINGQFIVEFFMHFERKQRVILKLLDDNNVLEIVDVSEYP